MAPIHKFSVLVLATVLFASAHAGYLGAPAPAYYGHGSVAIPTPAITSQSSNILRSYGNLGQVSTFSKTIDTPYSSVSKSDVRVSNPGIYAAPAYRPAYAAPAYAAPAYAPAIAAPAYAPAAYARPALAHPAAAGLLGVAYSPATSVSSMTYSAPALGLSYAW
ncbi:cuticle protein 76-like [Chrysoperla carnea]|uniref:cuticle protein 76-like n=1 Tax=Chrysoperla carnea TaxID=189513 RepID=UPI001D05FAE8|nr:cuticle protein 76-like [Chrysoperla carnea]